MRISDATMEQVLERSGVATPEQVKTLKEESSHSRRPLQDTVTETKLMSERAIIQAFADYTKIPFIKLDPHDIPTDVLTKIPERIARQYNVILFKIDKDATMHLAMEDPDDVQALDFIQKEIGENTKVYIATRDNILACIENYRGDVNQELNDVIAVSYTHLT